MNFNSGAMLEWCECNTLSDEEATSIDLWRSMKLMRNSGHHPAGHLLELHAMPWLH